jgi:hypothetical protein
VQSLSDILGDRHQDNDVTFAGLLGMEGRSLLLILRKLSDRHPPASKLRMLISKPEILTLIAQ